ncbi:hypothetical protein [Yersinia enterocolitica]|uniref:Exported protein n=1 Tax=Yersinia enterocolitica serotype O:8 / biotype 1B (strain NCTC 13174 / 8081) TaxID=393305 RepID=A1JQR7_YERE8|nr:hypothetical protein [Yersinia enterocolitica]AJJ22564.1 putative exported protein [Yersinia enterocolitica]CAL13678.1 putative exported protein [Yersinia enterocolitica subsp. enterocolitica 8081]HDL8279558.1 hypothetical protein [Yersinia enterocolitica]HDM8289639.1 hypothetical protein [Yersinia enterocolitica]HDM8293750.1 hypothetical protein [Yersinia enterocolitica]
MKYSRTLLSLLITGALSLTALNTHAAEPGCAGEEMPLLSNAVLTCATDLGINPNQEIDLSAEVSTALSDGKSIFFPAGSYLIGSDMVLNEKNSLVGSEAGVTILRGINPEKAISIGNKTYGSPVNQLTIKNIIFDNATVNFYGNKKNITIINNAFINTNSKDEQLTVSHHPFIIHGNVLLRDKNHPGLGIGTYRNTKTKIENNVIGDISDKNILLTLNYYDVGTFNVINKIKDSAKNQNLNVLDEQGYFIAGWYATDGLKDSVFRNNVISGNTLDCLDVSGETEKAKCTMTRDHVIYIKQYNNVDVVNNYFSGWPLDAAGNLKFRNASHLYFAGNYLNKTEFNARPYNNSDTLNMDNTFIFNNMLKDSMIGYWQNFEDRDDYYINAKNFVVFDNLFMAEDQTAKRISSTWRSTHGEFLEANNRYTDQTSVLTGDFQMVDIASAKALLPADKTALLAVKPIPLWKKMGDISGQDLQDNQLVRLDIEAEGYPSQFVVYSPDSKYHYPGHRWAAKLTALFNEKIKGACAGVLTSNVTTNNSCKFMAPKGSSYLNNVYTTEGGAATYTTKIIDKYLEVGYISGSKIQLGQTVKLAVTFEDGTHKEVAYTPDDEYRTAGHRWTTELAHKINANIPGLCSGKYTESTEQGNGIAKCGNVVPSGSSYLNKIYTVNGQSAKVAISIN